MICPPGCTAIGEVLHYGIRHLIERSYRGSLPVFSKTIKPSHIRQEREPVPRSPSLACMESMHVGRRGVLGTDEPLNRADPGNRSRHAVHITHRMGLFKPAEARDLSAGARISLRRPVRVHNAPRAARDPASGDGTSQIGGPGEAAAQTEEAGAPDTQPGH